MTLEEKIAAMMIYGCSAVAWARDS
jgi:hypothetical protein